MPKHYRLTVADLKTFRPKRRLHGAYFSLAIDSGARTQAACVVSKKIAVHAVDRNTIKRRTRAALLPYLSMLSPAVYVFYAKKEAKGAAFAEIQNDIKKLAERCAA